MLPDYDEAQETAAKHWLAKRDLDAYWFAVIQRE
jgi:hypothetical protein